MTCLFLLNGSVAKVQTSRNTADMFVKGSPIKLSPIKKKDAIDMAIETLQNLTYRGREKYIHPHRRNSAMMADCISTRPRASVPT